jgi:fucose permease
MKTMTANALQTNKFLIRALTYLMFMMFAMTTDSVGVIIPVVIKTFHLSLTAASAFHYASMSGIALAAIFLGFIADLLGRKTTIIVGLALFAIGSYLFAAANSYLWFVLLLFASGVAIGVFKTGALALIGDISQSTREHTSTMNMVEGFFGVGSIIGPAIVARLLIADFSWKWLYVIAGTLCALLLLIAALVKYPRTMRTSSEPIDLRRTIHLMKNPFVLGFSLALFLYVTIECAVYVWLPTYLIEHKPASTFMAAYVVAIFFVLRAGGRFLGAWVIARWKWSTVVMVFSGAVLACFVGAMFGGTDAAVCLLALSGLFMSVLYPTLNSKGISCFPKSEHGAVAGVLLFFTCGAAALGPFAMGAISDLFGDLRYGFALATVCAGLLFAGLLYNWMINPTRRVLQQSDLTAYNISI